MQQELTHGGMEKQRAVKKRKKKSIPAMRQRWNKDFGSKMKTRHRKRFVERERVTMRRKRIRPF